MILCLLNIPKVGCNFEVRQWGMSKGNSRVGANSFD